MVSILVSGCPCQGHPVVGKLGIERKLDLVALSYHQGWRWLDVALMRWEEDKLTLSYWPLCLLTDGLACVTHTLVAPRTGPRWSDVLKHNGGDAS